MKKVIIIGGGAAGMMAGYFAAENGNKVIIMEKNHMLGKKLRITGKGRCNITNSSDIEDIIGNIYKNGNFMYSSLYSFTNEDTMRLFEKFGLRLKTERGNRVFPESDKAIDVVRTFEKMLKKSNIEIWLNTEVKSLLTKKGSVKGVKTKDGKTVYSDAVIIATGGISYPLTGSTGDGYRFARECGHNVTELKGSLIGLETEEHIYDKMVGLTLKNIEISLYEGKKKIYSDFGELEFRNYGLDGPVIKSASCFVKNNRDYRIVLDLKPALTEEKLDRRIQRDFEKNSNKQFMNSLNGLLPKDMIDFVIDRSGIDRHKVVHQITREERMRLLKSIKNITFSITGARPVEEAIVTSGGVNVKEINPGTMESKIVENLYFCGEVIDVDGFTGGYNLQIAFSTAYLAGMLSH